MHQYNDLAIPIAWPDQTARGDELWMAVLKKLGIVKNLNFKVGHAAIVLIEKKSGDLKYFDFGRYIVPRGFGRARSSQFDPRLELETKAIFSDSGELLNLEEILCELTEKESATHGGGRLLCSISERISFNKGVQFAEALVDKGPVLYGALAPNNNSCSRYVAQILVNAMEKNDPRSSKIFFPECLKSSPTSNVVNANDQQVQFCYHKSELERWNMDRKQSLKFQIGLLKPNFIRSKAQELPDDNLLGYIEEPNRPEHLPKSAQWLGGLGEGCWFSLLHCGNEAEITKYNYRGEIEYTVVGITEGLFSQHVDYEFSYEIHQHRHVVKQNNEKVIFNTLDINNLNLKQSI
ncbi:MULTISPECIES: DUF6695 family protein [Sphingobacterium]|uniref:DUF6695 family protein n=1 Tax=Sphingobacterium TaxID=28453 RepID=UPI00240E5CB4|nr:DUF6695 family protein [Sphingobacterium sp. WM]WFB65221.1 hypothetical protein PZ892_08370 [Sphingobacterium sp. WM]